VFSKSDAVLANANGIFAFRHGFLRPAALHGIKGEQMRGAIGSTFGIIDDRPFEFRPIPGGAERETADAAETIDANTGRFHAAVFWLRSFPAPGCTR